MSAHKIISELSEAKNATGLVWGLSAGTPTASVAGYSKGAVVSDTSGGKLYINTGTNTAAVWSLVGLQS